MFILIECFDNYEEAIDYCKVADIVSPIFNCANCKVQEINLDPYKAEAYTEDSYNFIQQLKIFGFPQIIVVLVGFQQYQESKKNEIKNLYQRFFYSEFSQEYKFLEIFNNEMVQQLFRTYLEIKLFSVDYRKDRAYCMADFAYFNSVKQQLEIYGFLKGTCISANNLIHIMGIDDDFQINEILVLQNPFKIKHEKCQQKKSEMINQNCLQQNFLVRQQSDKDIESLQALQTISEMQNNQLQFNSIDQQMGDEKIEIQNENIKNIQNNQNTDDNSSSSEYNLSDEELLQNEQNMCKYNIYNRKEDELDFEDEADYATDEKIRDKYKEFKGASNFQECQWNLYDSLPFFDFSKIWVFKNIQQIVKESKLHQTQYAVGYDGFYVKIVISNVQQYISQISQLKPLVISNLLPKERKITIQHYKIQKKRNDVSLKSNELLECHSGFRKFKVQPIFSRLYPKFTNKTKYENEIKDSNFYLASYYQTSCFTPQAILMFKDDSLQTSNILFIWKKILIASGHLYNNDALHVILQRKILTGYPIKIHKKKCVVRMMFFNKEDVDYYKQLQLQTKFGLKGHIVTSLGTHGLMKCQFNNFIKGNDIVQINLFKRIFPNNDQLQKLCNIANDKNQVQ